MQVFSILLCLTPGDFICRLTKTCALANLARSDKLALSQIGALANWHLTLGKTDSEKLPLWKAAILANWHSGKTNS